MMHLIMFNCQSHHACIMHTRYTQAHKHGTKNQARQRQGWTWNQPHPHTTRRTTTQRRSNQTKLGTNTHRHIYTPRTNTKSTHKKHSNTQQTTSHQSTSQTTTTTTSANNSNAIDAANSSHCWILKKINSPLIFRLVFVCLGKNKYTKQKNQIQ